MLKAVFRKPKYLWIAAALAWLFICYSFYGTIFKCGFGPGLADYDYQLNTSCKLSRNSAHVVYIVCDGIKEYIPEKVVELGWNDAYVIAKTHPVTKPEYPNSDNTYMEPDDSLTYWWIADLQNKRIVGPLSQTDYNRARTTLPISTGVQLTSVDEAKERATWLDGDFRDVCN